MRCACAATRLDQNQLSRAAAVTSAAQLSSRIPRHSRFTSCLSALKIEVPSLTARYFDPKAACIPPLPLHGRCAVTLLKALDSGL